MPTLTISEDSMPTLALPVIAAALLGGLLSVSDAWGQWTRHTIDSTSQGADGVRLADVNRDGHLDVATAWEEGGVVRVYVNPGPSQAKQPWPRVTVGRVSSGEDAVPVDLDEDGATDVISATEGRDRAVYVHWAPTEPERYLQSEAWTTESIPAMKGRQRFMFVLPMQVDGRHGMDLMVGSKGDSAAVGWLRAPPAPRALGQWRYAELYDAGWMMTLFDVDMDEDGDQDVLASDRYGTPPGVLWLERPAADSALATSWPVHRIGPPINALFIDRADLDGDGRADVLATERPRRLHVMLRQGSNGWRHRSITYDADRFGTAKAIRGADVNQDGVLELVVTCEHADGPKSGVFYLAQEAAGAWKAYDIGGPAGVKFDRIELLDLDGDGDRDLLTCEEHEQLGVIWYENPTR